MLKVPYLEQIRRSYDAVAADSARSVKDPAELERGDGELGGILAFYSTHPPPSESLPGAFAEFHRALAPGGHLLVVTRVRDDGHQRLTHGYGGPSATFDCYRLPADRIA